MKPGTFNIPNLTRRNHDYEMANEYPDTVQGVEYRVRTAQLPGVNANQADKRERRENNGNACK